MPYLLTQQNIKVIRPLRLNKKLYYIFHISHKIYRFIRTPKLKSGLMWMGWGDLTCYAEVETLAKITYKMPVRDLAKGIDWAHWKGLPDHIRIVYSPHPRALQMMLYNWNRQCHHYNHHYAAAVLRYGSWASAWAWATCGCFLQRGTERILPIHPRIVSPNPTPPSLWLLSDFGFIYLKAKTRWSPKS